MRLLCPGISYSVSTSLRYTWVWMGVAVLTYVPPLLAGMVIGHRVVGTEGKLVMPYFHGC